MLERIATLPLSGETWSTPAIHLHEGRGIIIAADREGAVTAFDASGFAPLWCRRLGGGITAQPVLAMLDGASALLVGTHQAELFALDPVAGGVRWRHAAPGMIRAAVAVADVDGDGRPEIILASYGPALTILSERGELVRRWKRPKHAFVGQTKRGIVAAPLVYDVDRDGQPEIVTAGRSPWIVCYDATGRPKWYRRLAYDSDSTPSFVEVDGVPIVLIGGGEHTAGKGDNALIALDGRDGAELWRANVGGAIDCAPTVSRLADGRVFAFCGTLASHKLVAIDLADGSIAWSRRYGPTPLCSHSARDVAQPAGDDQCRRADGATYFTEYARCRSYVTPLVADLDGDGRPEVVSGSNNGELIVLDAETGRERFREDTGGMVRGSTVVADIDGDGYGELVVPSGDCLAVYRASGNPPPHCFFKGRGDMLGADHEPPPATGPRRPAGRRVDLRMWWDLRARDAARYAVIQIDKFVLRRFGPSRFDYYY